MTEKKKEKHSAVKNCPFCKKKLKMDIISSKEIENKYLKTLVNILSPGGVSLNQRYKCPRCFYEFNDMSITEAVIIPLILIGIVILSVILFIAFVFFAVA